MTRKTTKRLFSLCAIAVDILAIVFATHCFDPDFSTYTSYVRHETYGGGAYTDIQNAAADTANNIRTLASLINGDFEILFSCFGYLFTIIGTTAILFGIVNFLSTLERRTYTSRIYSFPNAYSDNAPQLDSFNEQQEQSDYDEN